MDLKQAAQYFGGVFIVIGVLGFIPGITVQGGLLGIFEVDALHNVIHILTGAVALLLAATNARLFFQVFGVVYGLVALVGFLQGNTVLGLFAVNSPDNILHLAIALVSLWFGFGFKVSQASPTPAKA